MTSKKKKNNNISKIISSLVIFICSICLAYSLIHVIKYQLDSKETSKQIEIIENNVEIEEVPSEEELERERLKKEKEEKRKKSPYWKYIETNLINVNFNDLKKINSETRGWIQVPGTNINYPFVQASDNEFYLNHSYNKSKNGGGWVFLDYRNNLASMSDKNTILYAHAMKDKTMFGTLKNVMTSDWRRNKSNHIIKISTEHENTLWQVFSVYRIPTTSDYIQVSFNDDAEYENFLNMLLTRSSYNFKTEVLASDRILTLSTCSNKSDKLVLHAKLIKSEAK